MKAGYFHATAPKDMVFHAYSTFKSIQSNSLRKEDIRFQRAILPKNTLNYLN